MPVLYAAHRLGEPIRRLVLINGIHNLGPQAVLHSFFLYYRRLLSRNKGILGVGAAVRGYTDSLFPGIVKERGRFGVLERSRAKLLRSVAEFFTFRPLKGVRLKQTPVLCLYSREDAILDIYHGYLNQEYRRTIRQVCPMADFQALEGDHFLSQPSVRGEAARSISSFFDA
jgi:hypothetical protein